MTDYTPEFFEDDDGREPVLDWLRKLPAYKRRAAVAAIEHILAREGTGVCGSGWGRWVKGVDGIFELRIRQDYGTIMRNAGLPVPSEQAENAAEITATSYCVSSAMPTARRWSCCSPATTRAMSRASVGRTRRSHLQQGA